MTTIVFKDGVLAVDSRITVVSSRKVIDSAIKIKEFEFPVEVGVRENREKYTDTVSLAAGCGTESGVDLIVSLLGDLGYDKAIDMLFSMQHYLIKKELMSLNRIEAKVLLVGDRNLHYIQLNKQIATRTYPLDKFIAMGSGQGHATAASSVLGLDAVGCIQAAAAYDPGTGGNIHAYSRNIVGDHIGPWNHTVYPTSGSEDSREQWADKLAEYGYPAPMDLDKCFAKSPLDREIIHNTVPKSDV